MISINTTHLADYSIQNHSIFNRTNGSIPLRAFRHNLSHAIDTSSTHMSFNDDVPLQFSLFLLLFLFILLGIVPRLCFEVPQLRSSSTRSNAPGYDSINESIPLRGISL